MDTGEYRQRAGEVLDLIGIYKNDVHQQSATPDVQPGFLRQLLPADPPQDPEPWSDVMHDVQHVIMNGISNRHSPHFHGYYPVGGSNAASLASMLQEAICNLTGKWTDCPAGVELEMAVMDWMVKSMDLPQHFLHGGQGGGVLVSSSSEAVLMAMCAARNKKIKEAMEHNSSLTTHSALAKLVVYSSQQVHFNVERACRFAMVQHQQVPVDKADHLAMRGTALQQAMDDDMKKGLIPLFVVATLGTTATCAFDNLAEIGPVCADAGCWLHVDAAYAGAAFLCPEFRHYLQGAQHVDSLSVNFYKWMLMGLGCSGFWLRDSSHLVDEFGAPAEYIKDAYMQHTPSFMSWQLQTCKGFHSLQMWFVIRLYGIKGLQQHIRNHVTLARHASALLQRDARFSITHPVAMGLVCFKLKGQSDSVNRSYLALIEKDRRLSLIGASDCDGFFLRLCMFEEKIAEQDVEKSVGILLELADGVLMENVTHV